MKLAFIGKETIHHYPIIRVKTNDVPPIYSASFKKSGLTETYSEKIEIQKLEEMEFYIPHKAVVRKNAESTKVRVVYDASNRTNSEAPSLSNCLNPRPPLQNDQWKILVRMRFHPVTLTEDIKQAFLQVQISESVRDALRFLLGPGDEHEIRNRISLTTVDGLTMNNPLSKANSWYILSQINTSFILLLISRVKRLSLTLNRRRCLYKVI